MADSFEALRKFVAHEVQSQREIRAVASEGQRITPAKMLGIFLESALAKSKRSRRHFARALQIDAGLATAILDGKLPDSEIDDALLVDIARVLKHEPNTLRLILGRSIVPTIEAEIVPPPTVSPNGSDEAQSGR